MNRLSRLSQLARAACQASSSQTCQTANQVITGPVPQALCCSSISRSQSRGYAASAAGDSIATDFEQATGLERAELEGKAKGVDIFHEDWLDAPWGTESQPVQVTSSFTERVVGVPDPYDDSIIWWGSIKEGEPPKQIVEEGEFFVLKRVASEDSSHGH